MMKIWKTSTILLLGPSQLDILSLFQWIFDLPDGGGRLLRLREGHSDPPTRIRFYGGLGQNILSAGNLLLIVFLLIIVY